MEQVAKARFSGKRAAGCWLVKKIRRAMLSRPERGKAESERVMVEKPGTRESREESQGKKRRAGQGARGWGGGCGWGSLIEGLKSKSSRQSWKSGTERASAFRYRR